MPIVVNLDVILAKRKMRLNVVLSEQANITSQNISVLKTGKAKAIRFDALNKICQPRDILAFALDEFVTVAGR